MSSEIAEECREQTQRQLRRMNLVIMGITGDIKTQRSILDSLFNIIHPGFQIINCDRIGQTNSDSNIIRPIRIIMDCAATVTTILRNCNKLKGLVQFEHISVMRDLTKQHGNKSEDQQ